MKTNTGNTKPNPPVSMDREKMPSPIFDAIKNATRLAGRIGMKEARRDQVNLGQDHCDLIASISVYLSSHLAALMITGEGLDTDEARLWAERELSEIDETKKKFHIK